MLKIDNDTGKLLRVPRLGLRTQLLAGNCDLRRLTTRNPEEFFSEIGEKLFLIGTDIGRSDTRSEDEAGRIDLLGVDLNGRSVAVLIEQDRKPSSFVRALLCSEWLAAWQPQHFLERISEQAVAELQQFLLTDIWQLNRDQRLILVAEGHSNETLWAAQNLRHQCGIDITLLRAALAVDSQGSAQYLFLRREYPAAGDGWATLVRPQGESGEAVDLDQDAAFAPPENTEAAATPPEFQHPPAADAEPKQEALRTLAGGLADYLGHAIAAVDGGAELALQEAPRDPVVRRRFEEISRVVERAGKLTDDLRIFAGRGSRAIERLDPVRLVEEVIDLAGFLALPNVRVTTEIENNLPRIEGDPAQIARVLNNLLENAVEALPDGGAISVRARNVAVDGDEFANCVVGKELPAGDYLFIEVSDTGFGMDDSLKARIFDPFFTTKAPGRGLGLAAAAGIVRNHGGALRVETRPGRGSTFGVWLPLIKQAGSAGGGPAAGGTGKGHSVLVVDEQESLRTLAVQTLEAEGFRVLTAADGWEALDIFAKAAATIDIVVWDAMMADLDAEEAFRAIRRIRGDARLVVSGPFPKEQAEQRFGAKLAAYIRKPFEAESLAACIRQLVEQQQAPSGAKAG